MALDDIRSLIDQGKYQEAYDAGRIQGYDPGAIASFVNQNYGTTWDANSLAGGYEKQSISNLRDQGLGYVTFADGGIGAGTPGKFGSNGLFTIVDPYAVPPPLEGNIAFGGMSATTPAPAPAPAPAPVPTTIPGGRPDGSLPPSPIPAPTAPRKRGQDLLDDLLARHSNLQGIVGNPQLPPMPTMPTDITERLPGGFKTSEEVVQDLQNRMATLKSNFPNMGGQ